MAGKDALTDQELNALEFEIVGASDAKSLSLIEGKARALAAVLRARGMAADLRRKESMVDTSNNDPDEGGVEREEQARQTIERRLARLRAHLESKALAGEDGPSSAQ